MVNRYTSMVIKGTNEDCDKHISEAITLHNAGQIQKGINPLVSAPTLQSDRKGKDIPYEKLMIIAELLK